MHWITTTIWWTWGAAINKLDMQKHCSLTRLACGLQLRVMTCKRWFGTLWKVICWCNFVLRTTCDKLISSCCVPGRTHLMWLIISPDLTWRITDAPMYLKRKQNSSSKRICGVKSRFRCLAPNRVLWKIPNRLLSELGMYCTMQAFLPKEAKEKRICGLG